MWCIAVITAVMTCLKYVASCACLHCQARRHPTFTFAACLIGPATYLLHIHFVHGPSVKHGCKLWQPQEGLHDVTVELGADQTKVLMDMWQFFTDIWRDFCRAVKFQSSRHSKSRLQSKLKCWHVMTTTQKCLLPLWFKLMSMHQCMLLGITTNYKQICLEVSHCTSFAVCGSGNLALKLSMYMCNWVMCCNEFSCCK